MAVTPVSFGALEDICQNLRAMDAEEVYNIRPHDSWRKLAHESWYLIRDKGRGAVAWHKGRPAGVIAYTQIGWPGVWEVWAFGTNDFKAVAIDLLRWGRKEAVVILDEIGGHRCQCDSRVGHDEAHTMIKALGGRPEGLPMQGYGKDGSSYQRFVWLRETDAGFLYPGFVRAA